MCLKKKIEKIIILYIKWIIILIQMSELRPEFLLSKRIYYFMERSFIKILLYLINYCFNALLVKMKMISNVCCMLSQSRKTTNRFFSFLVGNDKPFLLSCVHVLFALFQNQIKWNISKTEVGASMTI